jgi:hypothetical protein
MVNDRLNSFFDESSFVFGFGHGRKRSIDQSFILFDSNLVIIGEVADLGANTAYEALSSQAKAWYRTSANKFSCNIFGATICEVLPNPSQFDYLNGNDLRFPFVGNSVEVWIKTPSDVEIKQVRVYDIPEPLFPVGRRSLGVQYWEEGLDTPYPPPPSPTGGGGGGGDGGGSS